MERPPIEIPRRKRRKTDDVVPEIYADERVPSVDLADIEHTSPGANGEDF